MDVVMLVRDRPTLTQQAMTTLRTNTSKRTAINVIVVDDESAAESAYLTAELCRVFGYTYVRRDKSEGTGKARNVGVAIAYASQPDHELLYLSDNDVYFTVNWDLRLIEALSLGPSVIGGWNHPYHLPTGALGSIYTLDGRLIDVLTYQALAGPSWLMQWGTWFTFGPLDTPGLGVCQGEDWTFGERVKAGGGTLAALSPPVVYSCGLTNTFGAPAPGAAEMAALIPKGVHFE